MLRFIFEPRAVYALCLAYPLAFAYLLFKEYSSLELFLENSPPRPSRFTSVIIRLRMKFFLSSEVRSCSFLSELFSLIVPLVIFYLSSAMLARDHCRAADCWLIRLEIERSSFYCLSRSSSSPSSMFMLITLTCMLSFLPFIGPTCDA